MMYYYNDFAPYHMFGFGSVFMLFFWGLIIYALYSVLKHNGSHHSEHALDILKERYAKGEITKDQFESMKKDIK